jgi:hypothetical protein
MRPLKALAKVLYLLARSILWPLLLLLRFTGVCRERLVASLTSLAVLFLIFPFVATHFGGNLGLLVLGLGVTVAYLFALWGHEFEAQ